MCTVGDQTRRDYIRCGVAVPRFVIFSGRMGDADIELDSRCVLTVFPDMASRRRFLSTVLLLLDAIRPGLDRKFGPSKSAVTQLLSMCDAGTRPGVVDLCGIRSLANFLRQWMSLFATTNIR